MVNFSSTTIAVFIGVVGILSIVAQVTLAHTHTHCRLYSVECIQLCPPLTDPTFLCRPSSSLCWWEIWGTRTPFFWVWVSRFSSWPGTALDLSHGKSREQCVESLNEPVTTYPNMWSLVHLNINLHRWNVHLFIYINTYTYIYIIYFIDGCDDIS